MRRHALLPIVLLPLALLVAPFVPTLTVAQTPPTETPPSPVPAPAPAPTPPPAPAPVKPAPAPVPEGPLVAAKTVPFRIGETASLGLIVGNVRVPELTITRDEANLVQELLPPSGGASRYSYLRFTFATENPATRSWRVAARLRLLDRNGAVVDEFEVSGKIGKGRAEPVTIKRLTLNYALQYIDRIEVSLSGS